jgi:hypothetical protein
MLTAAERGNNSSWLQEDSFTAFDWDDDGGNEAIGWDGDDGNDENDDGEPVAPEGNEEFTRQAEADLRNHEQYCPNCSGPSPTGGNCLSCRAMLTAAERGDNSSRLQEDSFTAIGGDGNGGNGAIGGDENTSAGPGELVDHHIYPKEFKDLFEKPDVDIDIDKNTVTMYAFQHWAVHSDGWNAEWNMYFEMYEAAGIDPTRKEVVAYGKFLMKKFGFADAPSHDYKDKGGDLGSHIM